MALCSSGSLRAFGAKQLAQRSGLAPIGLPQLSVSSALRVRKHQSQTVTKAVSPTDLGVRLARSSVDESQFWHEPEVLAAVSSYDAAATDSLDQQQQDLQASLVVQEPEDSLFSRAWKGYSLALKEHPILVKSATSFCGFLIGDTVAQTIVGHGFDHFRTLRLVLFGMFMDGPVGHVWYNILDKNVMPEDPTCNKAVVIKMLLDQFIWAPIFSCVFFTFLHTLEGHPEAVLPSIQHKLFPLLLANYALWPIAHLINFKFIPSEQRILYINCVQIIWSAYLSNLASVKLRTTRFH